MKHFALWLFLSLCCCAAIGATTPESCFNPQEFTAEKADALRKTLPAELAGMRTFLSEYRRTISLSAIATKRVLKRLEMADRLVNRIEKALASHDRDELFFAARSMHGLKFFSQYLREERELAATQAAGTEKTFDIRDYGAKGDGITDDSAAFAAAIAAALSANSPAVIRLPKGNYLLDQTQRIEGRNCHLVLSGAKHLTLEGETADTTLTFGVPEATGVAIVSGEDVTLRNLTLTSKTTPFLEMELTSVDAKAGTVNGRHIAPSLPPDSPLLARASSLRLLFRKDGSLVTGDLWTKEKTFASADPNNLQMSFRRGPLEKAEPGMRLVIPVRSDNSAVWIYQSRFTTAENVTLRNSWGLGFASHVSHVTTLSGCRIIPAPGLSFSTNADGCHSASSGGSSGIGPALFDCEFRAMGDDPFNSYNKGWYLAAANGNELLSQGGGGNAGDLLYVYSSAAGQVQAALEIAETTQSGAPWRETQLNRSVIKGGIPAFLNTFDSLKLKPPTGQEQHAIYMGELTMRMPDLIFNPSRAGAWSILSGCTFADNRNCGPVLQSDNALLEHCTIENMESHAVKIGAFSTWREGPPPVNVLMRNCAVRNSGGVRTEFMVQGDKPGTLSPGRHIRNITFEKNEIINSRTSAFSIESASGVEFLGNRIANPRNGAFAIGNAGNLTFRDNLLDGKPFRPAGGELVFPVRASRGRNLAMLGNWRDGDGGLRNSGSGFEALHAAQYSALKELRIKTTFRFAEKHGKAGLRVIEHVGVPDNGYYFLLNGETGEFTAEIRSRSRDGWKVNRVLLARKLDVREVNTLELSSNGSRLTISVNGLELWRGGAPLPTLFRSGFAAFDAPVSVETLDISAGGRTGGILAFGDSITHHCRWQDALGNRLKIEITNAGMACDDTVKAGERLDTDVIALRPELVLILLGTNNASAEQAMKDLDDIAERLKKENIRFLFCSILPRPQPERAKKLNALLSDYCRRNGIPLHDWHGALDDGAGVMKQEYGGGVHPNAKGVDAMVESFLNDPAMVTELNFHSK